MSIVRLRVLTNRFAGMEMCMWGKHGMLTMNIFLFPAIKKYNSSLASNYNRQIALCILPISSLKT